MGDVNNVISIRSLIEESGVCFGTSGMRGLAANMTEQVCGSYVTAFLQQVVPDAKKIVLGHDLRPSSPFIVNACAAAILTQGIEVIFAGALPTPALALYALQENIPAIMVTGSHIPFDRNGIKFYTEKGEITKADEIAITNAAVPDLLSNNLSQKLETSFAPIDNYRNRYLQFFPANFLQGMRIGVYEHSSVARDFLSNLLTEFGATIISLGRTDDFVPIDTEAVSHKDQELGKIWATQYKLDAILSTDGDADRPLIGDETGTWFRGDVVGLLCAKYLNANTVVTPISSTTAIETSYFFDNVIRTKIGSPYVIKKMEEALQSGCKCVVGFEANGGFLVGNSIECNGVTLLPLATRDAVLPMLSLFALAKEWGMSLSKLETLLPRRFTASGRIKNIPKEQSLALINYLSISAQKNEKLFSSICGKLIERNELDGLRLTFDNGDIIHLRASGNAPELRCYTESTMKVRANDLVRSVLNLCKNCDNMILITATSNLGEN